MVTLDQVRVQWTGVPGMPGVSTFYFASAGVPPLAALKTFMGALATRVPTAVVLKYPSSGLQVDSGSGAAVGSWSLTAPSDSNATGTGTWSAPVGAVVNWRTGAYIGGKEVRGKTFVVPLAGGQFGSDGRLLPAAATAMQNDANTFISAANSFRIWSRSKAAAAAVTNATVPGMAVVLRTRRD